MTWVFCQGQFIREEEAHIPITDRGFQFGDGAFATIQVSDGTPLFLETHLEQLKKQCLLFNLSMPNISHTLIEELIQLNEARAGCWRLKILITGGDGPEAYLPNREGRVVIVLKPFVPHPFKPLQLGIFSTPYSSCHASFKSLAHLNRFYVMEEARRQGLDDCVTLTELGNVLEAAFGNLFWVQDKVFMTPDPSLPLYFGVTIKNMIQIAQECGFTVRYIKTNVEALPEEAAAFRTNTMQGVRPVIQIGVVRFKRHPVLETLFLNGYQQLIEAQKRAPILSD